ncbi:DHA1 family bicyclomycin/chloramphenicol resistance-like MFS transporter [Sphingomonas kaistensis]|uniref:DHA1 family bicyclomycin/chloramphenicol resistance-like MFS transporter n=1 Tax=Sphingomonas kaistensis TaxID=298708 RepID=A0A7X6BEL9_9SPHN|nr:MFS transporter [Sphingomonas kaistensis]NJC04419.1 DHA1 family bicyclomycin/chloramphenicol resistance-like MFS transporter [Sphingomonas kaistensis]
MNGARLVLLGAIAALGSLAIQMLVPALPDITASLVASSEDGQLLITGYLAVLAMGQLGWAPVADRIGRRPVILIGLLLFLAGTFACVVAQSLELLLGGRLLQAAGASSSLVTARAMATDGGKAGTAAAPLAVLTSVTLISPALAPVVGGIVVSLADWRMLFWLLAGLGVTGLLLAWRFLPETLAERTASVGPTAILRRYGAVAVRQRFLPLALANMLASAGFYLFLAVSPFVLEAAGATPAWSGLFYSVVASAIIAGTLLVPPIVRRWPQALWPAGSVVMLAGAAALCLSAAAPTAIFGLLAAMSLVALGSGLSGPALLAEAIERQRGEAASVASLFGTLQMGGAALLSTLAVRLAPSPPAEIAMIGGLMFASVLVRQWGRQALPQT